MSKAEPKSYWRVARVAFMVLAVIVLVVNHDALMASVWLACSLICHATRTILDALERQRPTTTTD
jgi:hypothetical protein